MAGSLEPKSLDLSISRISQKKKPSASLNFLFSLYIPVCPTLSPFPFLLSKRPSSFLSFESFVVAFLSLASFGCLLPFLFALPVLSVSFSAIAVLISFLPEYSLSVLYLRGPVKTNNLVSVFWTACIGALRRRQFGTKGVSSPCAAYALDSGAFSPFNEAIAGLLLSRLRAS